MPDIVAVVIENPEQPIKAILAPGTGEVAAAIISEIGPEGRSGYSGYSGGSGFSGPGGGQSGFSGYSGTGVSGYSGYSSTGTSGYSGFCGTGTSGFSGYSGAGLSGYSGFSGPQGSAGSTGTSGFSGYSGFSGSSGYSGFCGLSGYSGYSGSGLSGYSGYSGAGLSGFSGYSGFCGLSGYSGFCGLSGYSGFSGSGTSGYSGYSGAGLSGFSGYSGFCGLSGYSGFCGLSGYSGFCGLSGYSGFCGLSGYSGFCGTSGYSGFSAASPGASGYSGFSGASGYSGYSGYSGLSGYSGFCGLSGYSGFSGANPGASGYSGYSGFCGLSGYSGFCGAGTSGFSGYSGFCGLSGYSGFSGKSGYSGFSGPSLLPTTTQTDTDYTLVIGDAETIVKMSSASAHTLTIPLNASVPFDIGTQIVVEQGGTAAVTVAPTGGVTLQGLTVTNGQYTVITLIKQATDTWLSGTAGSGYSGYSGKSGYSGYSGYSGFSGPAINKLLYTQNTDIGVVVGTVVSKAGTVTGAVGVGSSLFLERMMVPAQMSLTEIQCAMSIGFPATNQGAGTMSRSMVIYSFGNSTSLASVMSISGTSAWNTGTSTAGASTSLTQFQGGWSSPMIQPMTFAASSLAPGEYVVGQIFNFAQASSTWTLGFYGVAAASSFLASAATNLTSATLGALSSGGLLAASGITGLTQIVTSNAANTLWAIDRGSSAASSAKISSSIFTVVQYAFVSSLLTATGSIHTATGSFGAVTNVALGALNSSTLAQLTLPNFGFIGTGSTTSGFPTIFVNGIMSTGAIPTAITLTSTAVTYSGSVAFAQPWFALVGS